MKVLKTALMFMVLMIVSFAHKAHAQIGPWPCGGNQTLTTYRPNVPYTTGNVVLYYGIAYQAVANNTSQNPCNGLVVNSAYWTQNVGVGSGGSIQVNGASVPPPANFTNSSSVTWSLSGSQVQATATGGGSGSCAPGTAGYLLLSTVGGCVNSSADYGITNAGTFTFPASLIQSGSGAAFTEDNSFAVATGGGIALAATGSLDLTAGANSAFNITGNLSLDTSTGLFIDVSAGDLDLAVSGAMNLSAGGYIVPSATGISNSTNLGIDSSGRMVSVFNITAKVINGVSYSALYTSYTDIGQRVNACITDAETKTNGNTTGICSSEGEAGLAAGVTQHYPIVVGDTSGDAVTWELPAQCTFNAYGGNFTGNVASTIVTQYSNTKIISPGSIGQCVFINKTAVNGAVYALYLNQSSTSNTAGTYAQMEGVSFTNGTFSVPVTTASTYDAIFQYLTDNSQYKNMAIVDFETGQIPIQIGNNAGSSSSIGSPCCATNFENINVNGEYATAGILQITANSTNRAPELVTFRDISIDHPAPGSPIFTCTDTSGGHGVHVAFDHLYSEIEWNSSGQVAPEFIDGTASTANACGQIDVVDQEFKNEGSYSAPTGSPVWQLNGTNAGSFNLLGFTVPFNVTQPVTVVQNNMSGTAGFATATTDSNGLFGLYSTETAWTPALTAGNVNVNGSVTTTSGIYSAASAATNTLLKGGENGSSSSTLGSAIVQGAANSGTGASGNAELLPGVGSGGGTQGFAYTAQAFTAASSLAAILDVVSMTTTGDQIVDAPLGSTQVVGCAQTSASGPMYVVTNGKYSCRFSNTPVIGDFACAPPVSTGTIGQAYDNGAIPCPVGQSLGIVTGQVSGNIATVLIAPAAPVSIVMNGTDNYAAGDTNNYFGYNINSLNISTEYENQQGGANQTSSLYGAALVPIGATAYQTNAVGAFIANQSPTTNAVAGYFQGRAAGNNARAWGLNPLCATTTGYTGQRCVGIEVDMNANTTSDAVAGIVVDGYWTANPTGSSAVGVEVVPPGGGTGAKWPQAFEAVSGCCTFSLVSGLSGPSGNSLASQQLAFLDTDGSGNVHLSSLYVDTNGYYQITPYGAQVNIHGGLQATALVAGNAFNANALLSVNGPLTGSSTTDTSAVIVNPAIAYGGAGGVWGIKASPSAVTTTGQVIGLMAGVWANGAGLANSGTGTITTAAGIYADTPTIANNNYALFSQGPSYLSGYTQIVGSQTGSGSGNSYGLSVSPTISYQGGGAMFGTKSTIAATTTSAQVIPILAAMWANGLSVSNTGAGSVTVAAGLYADLPTAGGSNYAIWSHGPALIPIITPEILYSTGGTALPSCNSGNDGSTAVVHDATTPTYMGAYTGGGAITAAVICSYNGSTYSWLTH